MQAEFDRGVHSIVTSDAYKTGGSTGAAVASLDQGPLSIMFEIATVGSRIPERMSKHEHSSTAWWLLDRPQSIRATSEMDQSFKAREN